MNKTIDGGKILWQGRPAGGISFHLRDILIIPLAGFVFTLTVFWVYKAAGYASEAYSAAAYLILLPGAVVLAVSFYVFIGRFIIMPFVKSGTTYLLTGNSAVIIRAFPFKNTSRTDYGDIAYYRVIKGKAGTATVRFIRKKPRVVRNLSGMHYDPNMGIYRNFGPEHMYINEYPPFEDISGYEAAEKVLKECFIKRT